MESSEREKSKHKVTPETVEIPARRNAICIFHRSSEVPSDSRLQSDLHLNARYFCFERTTGRENVRDSIYWAGYFINVVLSAMLSIELKKRGNSNWWWGSYIDSLTFIRLNIYRKVIDWEQIKNKAQKNKNGNKKKIYIWEKNIVIQLIFFFPLHPINAKYDTSNINFFSFPNKGLN